jgi:hypothetical protein
MAKRAVSALFLMGFALQIAFAQTQAINGSIRGRVTDAAGASVPKANVTAANADTGFSRTFETAEDGYFVFPNLPLGTYTVTVQKTGFDTQKFTNIVLDAGKEAVLEAALKVGSVSTTVEVTTGAPVIEPSRVSTGRTIEHDEVDNLPLTSRNPYNFVIFQPGVSGHPNPELGIPRTINTNGLLDRINYQMDGMVNTESDRYGLRLFPISDIYVREVQTVSNSFAPEFGQTSGSIYNVITNSGTNAYHGEFYFIGRPPDAVARPILLAANKVPPAIDLHDYAVNSSGAIIKDKFFIFGGYEHLLRALPSPNTINQTTAAQIGLTDALLATAPAVQHAQFVNLRLDYIINQKHQIFIRYNYFRNEYPFNTAVGGTNALDVAQDFHDRAHVIGMQFLSTFTPTLLNEFRGSIPYRNEAHAANPADGPGPRITVTGIATFNGYGAGFPGDHYVEKIPSLSDNVTWLRGAHSFKAGFGWQENNDNQLSSITYNTYNFASAAAYLAAKAGTSPFGYSSYQTAVGLPGTSYKSYFYNLYAQDSWQLRPNLLMIYGVRWDRFQAPNDQPNEPFIYSRSFHTPSRDWAPRLGFAWTITPKTVIRTNFGLFYEAPPTNVWFNALAVDGARSFTASYTPIQAGAPSFPNVISSTLGATPGTPSIISVTPNFKNAYTINANFQITREITKNDALTVGYIHTAGRDQGFLRNMNLINPISFLADGRPVYGPASASTRLFPQFNAIRLQDVGAISDYNAMIVSWNHRLTRGVLISANYTWSHSISDAPDANSFEQNIPIEDPTSRARERGNSIVNRPNAFHLSAVLAPSYKTDSRFLRYLINGNQLTILGQLSSGDQQNITSSVQPLNGDSDTASQRPLYIGRDTVRGPKVIQFDARYTRTIFKFRERFLTKVLAEANNVTNHKNITTLNTSVPTTSAGVPTLPAFYPGTSTVLEGRIIQLGIRADW